MGKKETVNVQGREIAIAKFKTTEPNAAVGNWMRNRNTVEYLGI
jgi:hypothetical protein